MWNTICRFGKFKLKVLPWSSNPPSLHHPIHPHSPKFHGCTHSKHDGTEAMEGKYHSHMHVPLNWADWRCIGIWDLDHWQPFPQFYLHPSDKTRKRERRLVRNRLSVSTFFNVIPLFLPHPNPNPNLLIFALAFWVSLAHSPFLIFRLCSSCALLSFSNYSPSSALEGAVTL